MVESVVARLTRVAEQMKIDVSGAPQHHEIDAGKTTCGVCNSRLEFWPVKLRLQHLNECWTRKRLEFAPVLKAPDSSPTPAGSISCVICTLPLHTVSSVEAFEHRILCQRSQGRELTNCPRCGKAFTDGETEWTGTLIAEHLYSCSVTAKSETCFADVQALWCERRETRANPAHCALCTKSLTDHDTMDAFNHRRICFQRKKLVHCPVCLDPVAADCDTDAILWHLHCCQRGGTGTVFEKDDFEALNKASLGSSYVCWRLFNANLIRRQKSHGRTLSYREKTTTGRNNGAGMYMLPPTRLRTTAMHAKGDGIQVVKNMRSLRPAWANLDSFRRQVWPLYNLPKQGHLFVGIGSEFFYDDIEYDWSGTSDQDAATSDSTSSSSSSDAGAQVEGAEQEEVQDQAAPFTDEETSLSNRRLAHSRRSRRAVESTQQLGASVPPGFGLLEDLSLRDANPSQKKSTRNDSVDVNGEDRGCQDVDAQRQRDLDRVV